MVTFSNLEVNRHGRTSWAEAMPNCPPHATYPEREKYEGKSSSWGTDSEHDGQMLGSHGRQQAERRICGLSHRTALIITAVALVIVIGAVGGGVGVMMATRRGRTAQGQTSAPSPTPSPKIKSSPVLQNSSLAALQWTDSVGSTVVDHYHVYYQLTDGTIAESAWDSDTATWTVSRITDPSTDVALGTPLSAAAGYPHVNTSLGIVRPSVYSIMQYSGY